LLEKKNYRDLAARNVLLRSNTLECVLADMGLARLSDREDQYQKTKAATIPVSFLV
jgi:hypothetical protein